MKSASELHFTAAVFPRLAKGSNAQWTASDSAVVVDNEPTAAAGLTDKPVPPALTFLPAQPTLPGKATTFTQAIWDAQGKLLLPI